jgi:hypothetical protein
MAMNSGLDRIDLNGMAGSIGDWPGKTRIGYFKFGLVWLPASLIAAVGAWMLLSGYASKPAEGEPVVLAMAVAATPEPPAAVATNTTKDLSFDPATSEAITPEQTTPIDGLKISSQSWRRGGLGSKALVTFTLRNGNDYAVRDIEISCAFARRDGSHLTDRSRLIHDTVNMKSRKTFARMHIGFVNVNASGAKCTLVAANRI